MGDAALELALFDFDHTVTTCDTYGRFLRRVATAGGQSLDPLDAATDHATAQHCRQQAGQTAQPEDRAGGG